MFRKITLLIAALLFSLISYGQQMDGKFAPNFTGTDIEGNTWTLYEILDQGKSVIMDISATWCGPCWDYHLTHTLDDYYTQYGPDGTDEVVVFLIEGDDNTNLDCLYGGDDCNGGTYGNWVEGTHYPIVDDASIAELYDVNAFPTIYHICPNRIVSYADRLSVEGMYNLHSNCPEATGANNFSIIDYTGFSGNYCVSQDFTPSAFIQNLGSENISSATLDLQINGSSIQTLNWTGSLNTFQAEEVTFDEITVSEDVDILISIINVNGISDDDESDNVVSASANLAGELTDNYITLEITPIDWGGGYETYWELIDENGNILYNGGNALAVNGPNDGGAYSDDAPVSFNLAIPKDGCYDLKLYEFFDDGFDNVEYTISNAAGEVLVSGPNSGGRLIDVEPMYLTGGTGIVNNATIVTHGGDEGTYCFDYKYTPSITVQNLGTNEITALDIEVSNNAGVLYNTNWTGGIQPTGFGVIELTEILIENPTDVVYKIISVNEESDSHEYKNSLSVNWDKNSTNESTVNLEIQTEDYAEEFSWSFVNSAGEVLASGANYQSNQLIMETINLEEGVNDCYEIRLVDSYGDGLQTYDGSMTYLKLTDSNNNEIINQDLSDLPFSTLDLQVEADLEATPVLEIESLKSLSLWPNPASEILHVEFNLTSSLPAVISIYNSLGHIVKTITENNFDKGEHKIHADISDLSNGLYYLQMANDQSQSSMKFLVVD